MVLSAYIILGLVCLLVSGGNPSALTFAGPTGFQTSLGESATSQAPSDALTAILVEELCESVRTGKERAHPKTSFSVCSDLCHPPVVSYARMVPADPAPAKGAAEKFSEFARAPPFRS